MTKELQIVTFLQHKTTYTYEVTNYHRSSTDFNLCFQSVKTMLSIMKVFS